jgi:uncharacterized protein
MKIDVAGFPKAGLRLDEKESPEIMEESLDGVEFNKPIRVKVSVDLVGRTLVVRGILETTAVLECNRCLRLFDYPVRVGDYTFTVEVTGDETIDLTESIRESIILTLPMKRLCSPECKGLCPMCGVDRNERTCDCHTSVGPSPFSELDSLKFLKRSNGDV